MAMHTTDSEYRLSTETKAKAIVAQALTKIGAAGSDAAMVTEDFVAAHLRGN